MLEARSPLIHGVGPQNSGRTLSDEGLDLLPKFCAKTGGVKTIKMAAKLASYLRCAVLETEVCQPEKATGSIGDETAHTVGSLGCTRMLSAAAGFLRAPAAAPPARRQDGPP